MVKNGMFCFMGYMKIEMLLLLRLKNYPQKRSLFRRGPEPSEALKSTEIANKIEICLDQHT
jgi:hypothetical protein